MEEFSPDRLRSDRLLLEKTLEQVEKDFRAAGIEIQFDRSSEMSFDTIAGKIKPELEKLMRNNYPAFMNLLYRVDISEQGIKKEAARNAGKEFEQVLSELILKRELQKVVIKEYFRNNKDGIKDT